ncbi:MAG: hypothetical protein AAFR87_16475, partial [Bacteroidota bacterium]
MNKLSRSIKIAYNKDHFMRITTVFWLCLFYCFSSLFAQSNGERVSLAEGLKQLEQKFTVSLYFDTEFLPKISIPMPDASDDFESSLKELLKGTGLAYINYRGYAYIIATEDQIERKYT